MIQNLGLLVAFTLGIVSKTRRKRMGRHFTRALLRLLEAHQSFSISKPRLLSKTKPATREHQAQTVLAPGRHFNSQRGHSSGSACRLQISRYRRVWFHNFRQTGWLLDNLCHPNHPRIVSHHSIDVRQSLSSICMRPSGGTVEEKCHVPQYIGSGNI